jgi:hypothetical protein
MPWWEWFIGGHHDKEPTQEELLQQPIDLEVVQFGLEDDELEQEMGRVDTEETGIVTEAPVGWWERIKRMLS